MRERLGTMAPKVALVGGLLVLFGASVFFWKAYVLGLPIVPNASDGVWEIELEIVARGSGNRGAIRAALPERSDSQRVFDENRASSGLEFAQRSEVGRREGIWRGRLGSDVSVQHRVRVELLGERVMPAEGQLELPPAEIVETYLSATSTLPSSSNPIRERVERLSLPGFDDGAGRLRTVFAYAADEIVFDPRESDDALIVLRELAGSDLGKSRLLVTLLRRAEIPARVVSGLRLEDGANANTLWWVEAWLGRWIPMSPRTGHFGEIPDNWLALARDDAPLVEAPGAISLTSRYRAVRARLDSEELATLMRPPNAWAAKLSLFRLPVATQEALRILLLLPLGALITAFLRNVVGVRSFGTFLPILIALGLRETELVVGAGVLIGLLLLGTGSRLLIERLHLLLVPRLCILLCIVVLGLTIFALIGAEIESAALSSGILLPVVILVMLIERFTITTAEEGLREATIRLMWTSGVALVVFPIFRSPTAAHLMFGFPELVVVAIGILVWMGGYTGYRLNELLRFRSILDREEAPA